MNQEQLKEQLDALFSTPEKNNATISSLKTLQDHAGWQIVSLIAEYNIRLLEKALLEGVVGETKEEIDRKRDKLVVYKEVINTPNLLIKKLTSPKPFQEESDPYDRVVNLVDK